MWCIFAEYLEPEVGVVNLVEGLTLQATGGGSGRVLEARWHLVVVWWFVDFRCARKLGL